MSTSLAEQLQRLAVPQTSVLKHSKQRPSLLFDPKEAAGLKRDTIYEIGLEGLEELIQKNDAFTSFNNTLFHISTKNFERSVQNAEANQKLNKNIGHFLLLLSPHFLLKCAHKALEWLINRYMIHEYNRDDLLKLILPYHESNIFVRVLQLLKFKDTRDSFYFLKSLQKPGVHLPKPSLLSHAATNTGFLKFVTEYMMQLLKVHDKPSMLTVAFNYYCTVFVGAIEYSDKVTEDQVSQMLPLLLKGLNSTISNYCAASYVITAKLLLKSTFSDKLLDKFTNKICDLKVPSLKTESTLILIILYQSQPQYLKLPTTAIVNLSEREWLPKILQNLNSSGSYIYPFLEVLIRKCAEEGINSNLKLSRDCIKNNLDEIKLDDSFVPTFLQCILGALRPKAKYSEEAKLWLTEIVQTLERQYPNAFDKEVYRILSATSDRKMIKFKKRLSKILKNSYKEKFDVFEKLYHPNPEFRGNAVKFLKDNFKQMRSTDQEMLKVSLINRLYDTDVSVVSNTLGVIKDIKVINMEDLKTALIMLGSKCQQDKEQWEVIQKKVVIMLTSQFLNNDWEIFLAVFPFLMPDSTQSLKFAKKIMQTEYFSNHLFFQTSIQEFKSVTDPEHFKELLLKTLENKGTIDHVKGLLNVLKEKAYKKDGLNYVHFLILSTLLPQDACLESGALILEYLVSYITVHSDVKYMECINNIILKVKKPEWDLQLRDFSESNAENNFILYASKFFFKDNNVNEIYLEIFSDKFCLDWQHKINCLFNLCISENPVLDDFKKHALNYFLQILRNVEDEIVKQCIYLENAVPIYLLILLCNDNREVRNLIFDILDLFITKATRKTSSYYLLLEGLQNHKEEILMDNEQTPLVVFNIIDVSNTKGKKQGSQLNAIRNQFFKFCCKTANPTYLKAGILRLFQYINTFDILEGTADIAIEILNKKTDSLNSFQVKLIEYVVNKIELNVISEMTFKSSTWKLIENCLKDDKTVMITNDNNITPTVLLLNQLDKDIFEVVNEEVAKKLLDMIIEVSSMSHNPEVTPAANRIFKHMDLDANLILEQLIQMCKVQSNKQDPKRKRVSVIPTVDILDTVEWKKGICILELIQDKKKIRNFNNVLQILFDLLKRCLDFDEQAAVEYPKQLLLSSILHCCEKSQGVLPTNVFNIESIVQCIRASQNPQTHHHALLVLAHTAHLFPSQVLQSMMAIFTFVGSSVLRHDDAYSFHIITKIIDTIIPILVQDNKETNIANVLRVFVDVLLDVPEHRKIPLYKQLLERIEVKENLYLFLLLVSESQVIHNKQSKENAQQRLDIAANLCREFPPEVVIYTTVKLLKYLHSLPDEQEESMEINNSNSETDKFTIATHTPKDFRHFKYVQLKYIGGLLGSQEFISQVATLSEESELGMESLFKELIILILQYIQRISKVADRTLNTPQAHYWKSMLHLSYDVLDCVNALISPQMFLLVTKGLIVHNLCTVRRRILELFNTKLQFNSEFFKDCDTNEMYALVSPIITLVEGITNDVEPEQEIVIQTALLSLKLIVKTLGRKDPEKFVPILEFITNVIKSTKAHNNVLASLVLCLAEFCISLKAHAIASLPEFMPVITKILKHQRNEESPSVLLRSILTTIEKIFDSLPMFLSPYLEKLLFELSLLISKWNCVSEEQTVQSFLQKINVIKHKIGTVLPLRILLPSIEQCYSNLTEKKRYSAVGVLMNILEENLLVLKSIDVANSLPELTNFFLNALQFRIDCESSVEANEVENHIVKALTVLILKLSESSFRPLYYKIYDWAVRSEVKSERLITFYNLSSTIAQSLKGLFVLFAAHFINNAAQVLDSCNTTKTEELYFEDETKNILLLENVLKTLNFVFLYDTRKFIQRDRFDILMQPLVDQLENTLGDIDTLMKRNIELLTPCMVHFALATADDSLWKQMNYQILLKMRHNEPKIRLITLHCLTEIVKKLGDEFLPLLPETIPFLAELLEDEEEDVEKACQKAVQEMEKVLGESLQKYF